MQFVVYNIILLFALYLQPNDFCRQSDFNRPISDNNHVISSTEFITKQINVILPQQVIGNQQKKGQQNRFKLKFCTYFRDICCGWFCLWNNTWININISFLLVVCTFGQIMLPDFLFHIFGRIHSVVGNTIRIENCNNE